MIKKKYKATEGAQFSKDKVQIYGACLDKIAEERGSIKPLDVVDEARDNKSPLHEIFDWDDNRAAEKYRLEQARHLINHITVEVKYDHTKKEQKAFFSVNATNEDDEISKVYVTHERAMTEPELRKQVIMGALREADFWRERYSEYKELNRIFTAIKITKRKIAKPKKKKKRTGKLSY